MTTTNINWYTRLFDYPKVMKAFIIDVDDNKTPREADPENKIAFSEKELQSFIGSDKLKYLPTHEGQVIVVDAYQNCEQVNVRASLLYKYGYREQIKGKALFCKISMIEFTIEY